MVEEKSMVDVVKFLSGMDLDKENVLSVYSAEDYVNGVSARYFNVHIFDTKYFIETFPLYSMIPRTGGENDTELFCRVGNVKFFSITSRGEYVRILLHQNTVE